MKTPRPAPATYQVKTLVPTASGRVRTVWVEVPVGRTLASLERPRPLRETAGAAPVRPAEGPMRPGP